MKTAWSGCFLHTGPMAAFESHGFVRTRAISPHRWVVTPTIPPDQGAGSANEATWSGT